MAEDEPADSPADEPEPLADVAEHVRRRRDEDATPDDPFVAEAFEPLEDGDLWEALDTEAGPDERIETGEAEDEHVVPKRSYCERCKYLSEPPSVSCTHPGTTIVEFADNDHVRVRNCPVVADRRSLGDVNEGGFTPNSFGRE